MNSILSFKNLENIDPDDVSVGDDLIQQMKGFHEQLMKTISIVTKEDEEENVSKFFILFSAILSMSSIQRICRVTQHNKRTINVSSSVPFSD